MAERRPSAGSSALNEVLKEFASNKYSLQNREQVAPKAQTIEPARPSFRSALSNVMRDAIDSTGLEGGYRRGLLNAAEGVETAADFLPVVGDVLGLEDASRAYGQGDMVGTGINMMGVVPIIGDVAAKGAKSALRDIGENAPTNPQTSIEQLSQDIESRYGLDSFTVYEKGDDVTLGMITVPKGKRKQGVGTAAMNDLIEYADTNNKRVKLTPDVKGNDQGTTSRKRLVDFYKRFGFVENKGRNKDFTVSEGMFRLPQALNTATELPLDSSSRMARSALRGLDMNPEARMQRASDQGYLPETVYHGTAADITEFKPRQYGGSVTKANSAKMGTWFSDNPDVSAGYAKMAGEDMPVQVLIDASNKAERAGQWDKANELMGQAEKLEQSGVLIDGGGQNIMPARIRGNLFEIDAEGATMGDLDDSQLYKWSREAKKQGFDGLKIKNFSDNADYGTYTPANHYLIFDPKNIRSTNAEFDPAKMDSADLLSSRQSERQMSALRGIA